MVCIQSDKCLQIFGNTLLQGLNKFLVDPQCCFGLDDFFLFDLISVLIIGRDDSCELEPSVKQLLWGKFSHHYDNLVAILSEKNVMGNAKLNQLIYYNPKHKGQWARYLWSIKVFTNWTQDKCLTDWAVNLLNLYSNWVLNIIACTRFISYFGLIRLDFFHSLTG